MRSQTELDNLVAQLWKAARGDQAWIPPGTTPLVLLALQPHSGNENVAADWSTFPNVGDLPPGALTVLAIELRAIADRIDRIRVLKTGVLVPGEQVG